MAADARILEATEHGQGSARLYSWSDVWVTLGRNQRPEDALFDLSVSHVFRPTGGAAVLHGHDLTIGIAMPLSTLNCTSREVKKAYLGLVSPILATLNAVGVPAALGRDIPDRGNVASPYCFGMKSDYDVLNPETGKKICGCAMRVTERGALLQASIPVAEPLVDPRLMVKEYMATPVSRFDVTMFEQAFKESLRNIV